MGLFSSKKKTYTTTSHSRLIEDSDIRNDMEAAILSYSLIQDTRVSLDEDSLTDVYLKQVSNSITPVCMGLRNWAKNTNYYFGIPEGSTFVKQSIDLKTEMSEILSSYLGKVITIDYAQFGPINLNHATYKLLNDYVGFDVSTNECKGESTKNGYTTYLEDFTIHYCSNTIENVVNLDYLSGLGYHPQSGKTKERLENRSLVAKPWQVDKNATKDYVSVVFSYWDNLNVKRTYTINFDFLSFEHSGDSNLGNIGDSTKTSTANDVGYDPDYYMVRYNSEGNKYIFNYRIGSGTHPKLDNLYKADVDLADYLPNLYLRINSQKIDDKHEAYKDCKKFSNKINVKYSSLSDEVHKIDNISDVSEVFMSFRVPVNSKDNLINRYVYEFLLEMYKSTDVSATSNSRYKNLNNMMLEGYAKDGVSTHIKDNAVSYSIGFTSMWYTDEIGSIGKVGTVTQEYSTVTEKIAAIGGYVNLPIHIFKKQISSNVYRCLYVYGLTSTQSIAGSYTSTASGTDENLMIPIDISLVRAKYNKEKSELLSKSMHIVFNTVKIVKQKWYQTGIFKVVMFIVAVAISYFTMGQGLVWYLALAKAVLVAVALQVATTLATKILVSVFGADAASIIAVVVAVVAMALGGYSSTTGNTALGFSSTNYMAAMNMSFKVANNSIAISTQNKIQAYKTFEADMKARMTSIDELRDELGLDVHKLDIYDLLSAQNNTTDIRIGESPKVFYERSLAVQTGLLPITLTHAYVYMQTRLPTFQDSMYKWRSNNESILS